MTNPFFYLKVWHSNNSSLNGQILTIQEYSFALNKKATLHSFTGLKATVCIVSDDPTITRNQKLDFAVLFMKGGLSEIAIDLDRCTSTISVFKPTPRY